MTRERRLVEFIRRRQAVAWSHLHVSLDTDGILSVRALGLCEEIVYATELVGITPWRSTPWPLVAGGVYEQLAEIALADEDAVRAAMPGPDDVAEVERRIAHHAPFPQYRNRYRPTVQAIAARVRPGAYV